MATTTRRRMTVADLEREGAPEGRWELINGELVEMSAAGEDHGAFGATIIGHLFAFVVPRRLGRIFNAATGFVITEGPPMVRMPDVSFVRVGRLPADRERSRFVRVMPDLAVEIISQLDRTGDVLAKAMLWLEAGVRILWLVDPDARTVTVMEPGRPLRKLTVAQTLDGGEVLPGFLLPVADIFSD